jgi:hypothetical protein
MVDEDESGIFRCKRFIRAEWFGHDVLLQKGKESCGCGRWCSAEHCRGGAEHR